ncbi:UNVERIFIED_CONTAM: hypothetical protein PYX00_009832 [Menopon gallinae]|uniref:Amino acid transporter n=1 Tax=Menopon gallinae TaxID=328185 RepID=A0AAW2HD25_9NEOP
MANSEEFTKSTKNLINGQNNFKGVLMKLKMNACADSVEEMPSHKCDASSHSNLELQEPGTPGVLLQWLKNNLLLMTTLAGVVFGAVCGFILRNFDPTEDTILLISYPGEIFMRLLKLLILPLIITSLISCSASLNAKLNGRIAVRTLIYFVLTSCFNACLGIAVAFLFHPGSQDAKTQLQNAAADRHVNILDSFLDMGRNMFPDNIFQAFFQQTYTAYVPSNTPSYNDSALSNVTEAMLEDGLKLVRTLKLRDGTNNIGIIAFSLLFGTVLGTIETSNSQAVIEFFRTVYEVVMKIMSGIMWLTPVGISSVICGKILSVSDIKLVITQLGWFILTVVVGIIIYQLIVMQLIYFVIIRRNPYKFYWQLTPGMLVAFATASTAAALPMTFQLMDEKVKIDQRITRFILPIGCSINMDGTALFLACATCFIAQLNNLPITWGETVTICLVSTAASMSSASVPSAALVLMLMVLTSIGCPTGDVSLLFAVDWLVDRCRTVNNMLGDCYASAVVEHLSREDLTSSEQELLSKSEVKSSNSVVIEMPKGFSNSTFCK